MNRQNATNDYPVLGAYSVGFLTFRDNSDNYLGGYYVRSLWSFRHKGVLFYALQYCDCYGERYQGNPIWIQPAVLVDYQKRAKTGIRQGMHNNPASRDYRKPSSNPAFTI
jgi:hypothetical protein